MIVLPGEPGRSVLGCAAPGLTSGARLTSGVGRRSGACFDLRFYLLRLRFVFVFAEGRSRAPPGLPGLLRLAELLLDLAEVVQHRGVGFFAGGRLLQLRDRFLIASQAIQHPAEAIAIGGVLRFGGDRLADHFQGPIEAFILIGPEVAQVVEGPRVIGKLVQHLLQPLLGLGNPLLSTHSAESDSRASRTISRTSAES